MIRASFLMLFFSLSANAVGQLRDFGHVSFAKADSLARLFPDHSLNDIHVLTDKLTQPLKSDVEKFRAIYTWVCLNIDNDYSLYQKNKHKQSRLEGPELIAWNNEVRKTIIDRLLDSKQTICTGYAYLIREMTRAVGVPCEMIPGFGRTLQNDSTEQFSINHSWNAVYLDDKWYLCDATWSSGKFTKDGKYIKEYNDAYFLADPEIFGRNHFPQDSKWLLVTVKSDWSTFIRGPQVFSAAYRFGVTAGLDRYDLVVRKKENIRFEYSTRSDRPIQLVIMYGDSPKIVDSKGAVLEYEFRSRGKYNVYLMIAGMYALGYRLTVN